KLSSMDRPVPGIWAGVAFTGTAPELMRTYFLGSQRANSSRRGTANNGCSVKRCRTGHARTLRLGASASASMARNGPFGEAGGAGAADTGVRVGVMMGPHWVVNWSRREVGPDAAAAIGSPNYRSQSGPSRSV